jgi:hypothetical protein
MNGTIAYALAKKYTQKVGSTITGTSYDYDTSKLIFNTENGDWTVPVNNGMNAGYKNTLDNIRYDNDTEKLEINGAEVLTKENMASGDLDFDGFFD